MTLRDNVLAALKDNKGNWISGEMLSKTLNVSRTAVWKQIKALQSEGYIVDSSPKKGYSLRATPDRLSNTEVCPGLTTRRLGQTHYIYLDEVDSTNNKARELAAAGYPEGTVVVAEMQTAGKGRRGRQWYSAPGTGIYVSIIFRPSLPLNEISRLTLVAALATAECLEAALDLQPRIKWPNDILVNNKKLVGILTEAVTDMDSVEYVVTGIGINLTNPVEDFPPVFRDTATSVQAEGGRRRYRADVLQDLLKRLEDCYDRFLAGDFAGILEQIKERSSVIGQAVTLDTISGVLTGQAVDIDDNGFLLVRDQDGKMHAVMSGEITVL